MPYDPQIDGERRHNDAILEAISDLKMETVTRLTQLETKQENLKPRCDSHAVDIKAQDERISSLEATRNIAKGITKAMGVGDRNSGGYWNTF